MSVSLLLLVAILLAVFSKNKSVSSAETDALWDKPTSSSSGSTSSSTSGSTTKHKGWFETIRDTALGLISDTGFWDKIDQTGTTGAIVEKTVDVVNAFAEK